MEKEKIDSIEIDFYERYRHNAYDGYECSWGILMGLGGDGNAFATDDKICGDEHIDPETLEYTCDCNTEMGEAIENFDESLDVEMMLHNLDTTVEEIQDGINEDDEYIHKEFCGEPLPIKFERIAENIVMTFDIINKHFEFIVENLK